MDGSRDPNSAEAATEKPLSALLTSEVSFLSIPERNERSEYVKAGAAVVLESVEKIIVDDLEEKEERGGGGEEEVMSSSAPKLNLLESMMMNCIDAFNNSAQIKKDLLAQGVVSNSSEVYFNLSASELEKHSCRNGEGGVYTSNGTYSIDTTPTGR